MTREELLHLAGERVDALVSTDVPSRNVIHILYRLAREKSDGPLCMAAARLLLERVSAGGVVLIATGWPDRPHVSPDIAETDGPPGAAALARALHRGLGATPFVLVEEQLVPGMKAVLQAAGFRVLPPEEAIASSSSSAPIHAGSVLGFPTGADEAKKEAGRVIDSYRPQAMIAIEKGGMNEKGRIHTSRGADTTGAMAKVDFLVLEASRRGVATVGIGDGGNEIGMGVIADGIKRHIRYGDRCNCGCGGGVAPSTVTDVLVTSAISNWGAYGVAACLAILLGRPEVFHDAEVEIRILDEASRSSFIDGITGFVEPGADGVPARVHAAFVTLLMETVKHATRSLKEAG